MMALSFSPLTCSLMWFFATSTESIASFSVPYVPLTRGRSSSSLYINDDQSLDRRAFLTGAAIAGSFLSQPVQARGLVQFPCLQPLGNTYHFLRAGQSLLEADDIWSTNPLFLTNREAALSETGIQQVEDVCHYFRDENINPTIVMYSLASSSMDTATIIGRELKVGRDRLVPEFTYLDPRAVGKWDMMPMQRTQAAVWAMDQAEAGADGMGARPPANDDSTPNETLANQSTRLRQLVSLMETQYSGDTVVLVFPDSTGPALLSAMIAGIPLNRVHELEFRPGEVRLDVTRESTLALLKERELSPSSYSSILAAGKTELARLRAMDPFELISVKDRMLEDDRLEMDEYQRKLEESRRIKEEEAQLARKERARRVEADRQRRRDQGEGDISPFLPILGAAAIGGAVLLNLNDEQPMDIPATVTNTSHELKEATMDEPITKEPINLDIDLIGSNRRDMEEMKEELTAIEDGLGAAVHAQINGDRRATFSPPIKPRDPVKAAEESMKEYMDSDDGGREWLQMISDLLVEDDEDDVENKSP